MRYPTHFSLQLPEWLLGRALPESIPTEAGMVAYTVELAARNVAAGTGGPFGAAVFDEEGHCIAAGVNLVTMSTTSVAHAEMVALMLAQQSLGQHRLGADGRKYILATSAQPCAMCFGAIPWSGVQRVLIGALREDVETEAGFDEGPLPPLWQQELETRGVSVSAGLEREAAQAVLRHYRNTGGILY
ncbi:MAG: nucleoside deaminase [Verrucomicrobiota bacterium]|nr:nucleoside deaminase [Verrucomicrobiota bacterium]